jgi:hypothetical protein
MRQFFAVASIIALAAVAFAQEEADYQNWMKTTGATVGSLRKNLEAKSGDAAAQDAKKLQEIFTQVHDFWLKKKIDNATNFATNARKGFQQVAENATAGKFDEAQAALKSTMANCAGCHGAYREKGADGSWKIKYN